MLAELGTEDHHPLRSKHATITALLPYAVWERDGRSEMLDAVLHAARASRTERFILAHINQFFSTLLSEASPRAIILVSPHIYWYFFRYRGDLVQWWAATVSAVPYTDEVAQCVVDTLLQIASEDRLVRYIPADVWSWLTKRPSLPPICLGRRLGTYAPVVKVVRGLKDIEVLKSYFLLVWSEWDTPDGLDEMCTSIREDFGGMGMRHHRTDMIKRLDHVLGQLDRGLDYLRQHHPRVDNGRPQWIESDLRKDNYRQLRETLLATDTKGVARTPVYQSCSFVY